MAAFFLKHPCSRVVSVSSIEVIGAELQYQTQPVVMCGAVSLKESGHIFLTLYNPCTDLDICISMAATQSVGFARAAIFWTMPSFIKGGMSNEDNPYSKCSSPVGDQLVLQGKAVSIYTLNYMIGRPCYMPNLPAPHVYRSCLVELNCNTRPNPWTGVALFL